MKIFKYFICLILSTQCSCQNGTKGGNVKVKKSAIYSNESFENFLFRISNSDSLIFKLIKIKPIVNEELNKKEFFFKNDSINIIYQENFYGRKEIDTYEADSVIPFLKFKDKIIKKYSGQGLSFGLDFLLSRDEIKYFSINKNIKFYLLKSDCYPCVGRFQDIARGYLLLDKGNEVLCFNLYSYNLPNDFYIGKHGNDIIYLGVSSNTINEDDKEEYIYEIAAYKLNIKTGKIEQIYYNNKEVEMKVAIPNYKDFSKYRIISNNWW